MAETVARSDQAAATQTAAVAATEAGSAAGHRSLSGWYVLGLATQVVFWSLIFLGIVIAFAVGGHLTEFRYVGF